MGPNKDEITDQKALEVGQNFAREYYQAAVTDVEKVLRLFGQDSVFADHRGEHHSESQKIREAITSLRLNEAGAKILGLNAVSTGNGVMVQVVVEYEFDALTSTSSECFYLVRQGGRSFYVRSAMFKWVNPHRAITKDANPTIVVPLKTQAANNVVNGQEGKKTSPVKPTTRPAASNPNPTTSVAPVNGTVHNGAVNGQVKPAKEPVKNQSWAARAAPPPVKPAVALNTTNVAPSPRRLKSEKNGEDAVKSDNNSVSEDGQHNPENQENKNPAKVSKAAITMHISGISLEPNFKAPNERLVSEDLTEQLKAFGEIDDIRYPQSFYRQNIRNIYMFVDFTNADAFEKIAAHGTQEGEGVAYCDITLSSLGFSGRLKFSVTEGRTARPAHGKRSPRHNRPAANRHNKNRNPGDADMSKNFKSGSRNRSNDENRPRRDKKTWTKTNV